MTWVRFLTQFSSIVDVMAKSLSSLRVSHGARSVKMKLTNKRVPCLTFEIQLVSGWWYDTHIYGRWFCVFTIAVTLLNYIRLLFYLTASGHEQLAECATLVQW